MSETEFVDLVREMRCAQIEYFRTRDKDVLSKSKALEKQVDKEIFLRVSQESVSVQQKLNL